MHREETIAQECEHLLNQFPVTLPDSTLNFKHKILIENFKKKEISLRRKADLFGSEQANLFDSFDVFDSREKEAKVTYL